MNVIKLIIGTIVYSAVYGFSIGCIHSFKAGARNLFKFPMLIFTTAAICAVAYYVFAKFITKELSFGNIQVFTLRTFHDISLTLASLAPSSFFLALVLLKPESADRMNEYPFFLGLNMVFISICGCVALARRAVDLIRRHALPVRRGVAVILVWLAISLFAGAQCSFYMRPFSGLAYETEQPFMAGSEPHTTGATNFYEVVWHIISPPGKQAGKR